MALHKAAASNSSVEVVRVILDANPDAAKEKGQVSRGTSQTHIIHKLSYILNMSIQNHMCDVALL